MLFGKKMECPTWYLWLIVIVGAILALAEMGYVNLMGLTWGPVFLILLGLGMILKKN